MNPFNLHGGEFLALYLGVVLVVLQYLLGPWIMDLTLSWLYNMSWVKPEQLPEHLADFIRRTCERHRMKFPSVALIHDGAPKCEPPLSSAGSPR